MVDEEGAATLTLDDESTDVAVPAELVEELQAKLEAAGAEVEEGADPPPPVVLSVNKTTKTVIGFA